MKTTDATALMRAIELGLVPKVKEICAKGSVDIEITEKYGGKTTPLFAAAGHANAEIVRLLLAAGANAKGVDAYGQSMLHRVRDASVAAKLLAAGADVNAKGRSKRTPLHHAAELGDADLVKLFVDGGADMEAKDDEGKTPFVVASKLDVRALLKSLGAKGLAKTDGVALKPKAKAAKPADLTVSDGALAVDADGVLWVAGESEIYRWDGAKLSAFEFEESFSVSQIAAGAEGRVYFATNWGLVVETGGAWRLYGTQNSEIHDQHITEMAVDREGRACLMGYGGEETIDRPISVFDGERFEVWTAGAAFPKGLATKCLAFDAKNRLVLGTESGVVFPDGKRFKAPGLGMLSEPKVLVADGDDIWVGASNGVHRVSSAGKATTSIEPPSNTSCILVDGDTVWIGMYYGGLVRVRGGEQKHFTPGNSGLAEEDVQGLALGKDGALWIAAGGALFQCRGDAITRFGEKAALEPAKVPVKEAPKKASPKPKKKLAPLPKTALVAAKKLAPHVTKAIAEAKLEGLDRAALLSFVRPAIGMMIGKAEAVPVGGSKLGGRPDLAPGAKWPTYKGERGRFLPLLFQINLADIAKYDIEGLLPKKGRLVFFCDTQPDEIADSRVVFDDGAKKATRLDWPEDLVDRKDEDDFVAQLPEHPLEFYATWTLPSAEYFEKYAELTDVDREALSELETKLHALDPKRSSTTRLLGWPDSLQGEIVSSPKTIVLMQIDGEMNGPKKLGELLSYWGNGIAHYLIDEAALSARKLEKARAELAYT